MSTKIEWTDETWNPVTGCDRVSPGCDHCYAETIANRFKGTKAFPNGFAVTLHPERLDVPLGWRKPRRVFVNSMSDLFHPDVPDAFIVQVFNTMALAPEHTFQVLTKRPQRMAQWAERTGYAEPEPNIWLGVSVESQRYADLRIPHLLATPAAVRFLSVEPLLGPVNVAAYVGPFRPAPNSVDWVIVGGESGPGARPMHPEWARTIRDECVEASVPFFFKQWGAWKPEPIYSTDDRFHVLMLDGTLRGIPWSGWKRDQPDAAVMMRVGEKNAGRELDGRTWDEYAS